MLSMKSPQALQMAVNIAITVLARNIKQEADNDLANFGLSHSAAWPLVLLGRLGEGIRQGVLADAIGIEGPSLVRLIDQLCAAGLMERKDDANDRRAKTLYLTEAGRVLSNDIEASLIQMRHRLYKDVSPDDLEACMRVFQSMADAMGKPEMLEQLGKK